MIDSELPAEAVYAMVSGFGGMARLAMGVKDKKTTLKGELFRIVVISMPMGTIAAMYAASQELGNMAYAVGYLVGIASINIARTVATEGLSGVLSILKLGK